MNQIDADSYDKQAESRNNKDLTNNYDDESPEVIHEIVTYEVPNNLKKEVEVIACSSSSDSHESQETSSDDEKSDSDSKSDSEICETICEIMTYQASVDSENNDESETIYETVTYEVTEKKVKEKSIIEVAVVDDSVPSTEDINIVDEEEVQSVGSESKTDDLNNESEELEPDSKSMSVDLDKNSDEDQKSGSDAENSESEDIFKVSSLDSKLDIFSYNSTSREKLREKIPIGIESMLVDEQINESPEFNQTSDPEESEKCFISATSEHSTAPFEDSTQKTLENLNIQSEQANTLSELKNFEDNCDEKSEDDKTENDALDDKLSDNDADEKENIETCELEPFENVNIVKEDNTGSVDSNDQLQEVINEDTEQPSNELETSRNNLDETIHELNEETTIEKEKPLEPVVEIPKTIEIFYKDRPNFEKEIIREKCHHFQVDAKVNWDTFSSDILNFYEMYIPDDAKHGDIITTSEKYLRSMEVYFVNSILIELDEKTKNENNGEYNYKLVRRLCQEDLGGSGYCCVPKAITNKLPDPIKFYENSFTFDNYDEIDFAGIDIDTGVHQELIKGYTGGKPVDLSRKCFWLFSNNEWDSTSGMFVWCDFFLDDFDAGRYMKLTPDIDEEYISKSPALRRDPQIVKYAIDMKSKYEDKYTNLFNEMDQGTELEVYGLTFFCPKNDEPNGGTMANMYFNRVVKDSDERIVEIILNADEEADAESVEFKFTQKIVTEYGRYGGVQLWCIEKALLPGEEDPNTFIICTSDIFY